MPPPDWFNMLDGQYIANDLLLAHQVAKKHVVRRVPENVAYGKYRFWSGFDGLLDLETVVQASCLGGQVRTKRIALCETRAMLQRDSHPSVHLLSGIITEPQHTTSC